MKVRVTHLKAPWPEGLGLNSVHEFKDGAIPPWAVGKCVPLGDMAAPPPADSQAVFDAAASAVASAQAKHKKEFDAVVEHHERAVSALKQELADAHAARDAALSEVDELRVKLAAAEKAVADAHAAKAKK